VPIDRELDLIERETEALREAADEIERAQEATELMNRGLRDTAGISGRVWNGPATSQFNRDLDHARTRLRQIREEMERISQLGASVWPGAPGAQAPGAPQPAPPGPSGAGVPPGAGPAGDAADEPGKGPRKKKGFLRKLGGKIGGGARSGIEKLAESSGAGGSAIAGLARRAGPWGLAIAGALTVVNKALQVTRTALDQMIESGEKITGSSVTRRAADIAAAFAKNANVAIRWGAAWEDVNKATLTFMTRGGMSAATAQEFTEQLAKGARMIGVEFNDAVEIAGEQMMEFGRTGDDVKRIFAVVQAASRATSQAFGGVGTSAGRTGGIIAKDLLQLMREVTKETGLFKQRSETLILTLTNLYMAAVRLGATYGQAKEQVLGLTKAIGALSDYGKYVAGQGARRRLIDPKQIAALKKELKELEAEEKRLGAAMDPRRQRRLREVRSRIGAADVVRRAPITGAEQALLRALEKGGKEGAEALKDAIKVLAKGEGIGAEGLIEALKRAGLQGENLLNVAKLAEEIAKGNKDITELPPEMAKQVKDAISASIRGRESPEQKIVGHLTAASNWQGALLTKLQGWFTELIGGVMRLVNLVTAAGAKWGFLSTGSKREISGSFDKDLAPGSSAGGGSLVRIPTQEFKPKVGESPGQVAARSHAAGIAAEEKIRAGKKVSAEERKAAQEWQRRRRQIQEQEKRGGPRAGAHPGDGLPLPSAKLAGNVLQETLKKTTVEKAAEERGSGSGTTVATRGRRTSIGQPNAEGGILDFQAETTPEGDVILRGRGFAEALAKMQVQFVQSTGKKVRSG